MKRSKKLVLVVDDEPEDIEAVRHVLEQTGEFEVSIAANYDEAIDVFGRESGKLALALLDVALPGKSGVELAKHLLAVKPSLRVLFVSGHVGASVIRFQGLDA